MSERFEIVPHHVDDAAPTPRGHLSVAARRGLGSTTRPGSAKPSASTALVIVDAVPIVMHVPGERAMPFSISSQSFSPMFPARSSAQYFHTSLPLPSVPPR